MTRQSLRWLVVLPRLYSSGLFTRRDESRNRGYFTCGLWIATSGQAYLQYVRTVRIVPGSWSIFALVWNPLYLINSLVILSMPIPLLLGQVFFPTSTGYGRRYRPRKNKRWGSHRGEVCWFCSPDCLGDCILKRIWRQVVRKDQTAVLSLWKWVPFRDTNLGLVVPLKIKHLALY